MSVPTSRSKIKFLDNIYLFMFFNIDFGLCNSIDESIKCYSEFYE